MMSFSALRLSIPIIGISGVTADNASAVLDACAWGVAVVAAVYGSEDPLAALNQLMEITGCG